MEAPSKLRKKSFTVVEQAIHQVRGFRNLYQELDDKVRLSGQSTSTLKNYRRKLAQLSLYFGKLPQPAKVYNLLFASSRETLAQFGYTNLHAKTGMVAILHTWGQNLSLHPHLHCVVPGGGIDYKGQWRQVKTSANGKVFLFRVENLSLVFRAKFICALQKQLPQEQKFIRELKSTNWVVYARLNSIYQMCTFNLPFFFPSFLGLRPTPLRISLNNLIVVESIIKISLYISPYVRLSDKKLW